MKYRYKLYPLQLLHFLFPATVSALIVPDNTMGRGWIEGTLINRDKIDAALVQGNNLLHSFSKFNIINT